MLKSYQKKNEIKGKDIFEKTLNQNSLYLFFFQQGN